MLRIIEQEAALCWSSHHLSKIPIDLDRLLKKARKLTEKVWKTAKQPFYSV
jgi:hypothetical protein